MKPPIVQNLVHPIRPRRFLSWPLFGGITALSVLLGASIAAAALSGVFEPSTLCMACHNGLVAEDGTDASFGFDWRSSMMANAARDPYWQASVQRETLDHPAAAGAIEDECAICHMPAARFEAHAQGRKGQVFALLGATARREKAGRLAQDGVSCMVCHRMAKEKLGDPSTFSGRFAVDKNNVIFGAYTVSAGLSRVMQSATGQEPKTSTHIQKSEVCASCHTLITHALGPGGTVIGRLPEQVPYLEWRASGHAESRSCQDCHLPVIEGKMPISSVLGEPREAVSRHVFQGGNLLVPRMLASRPTELGVQALPQELSEMVRRTTRHLAEEAAHLSVENPRLENGVFSAEVVVRNLAGHKLPTAYPSRRAWLHVQVLAGSELVFESGALASDGQIQGNDNDQDPTRFEPHYQVVDQAEKVQIYEPILHDASKTPTTGLLKAVGYLKDNRILPDGFDKLRASTDIAVHGEAARDEDFIGGEDRVRYQVPVAAEGRPVIIKAALRYQPIGFRWAMTLQGVKSTETRPLYFIELYKSLAHTSAATLARAEARVAP